LHTWSNSNDDLRPASDRSLAPSILTSHTTRHDDLSHNPLLNGATQRHKRTASSVPKTQSGRSLARQLVCPGSQSPPNTADRPRRNHSIEPESSLHLVLCLFHRQDHHSTRPRPSSPRSTTHTRSKRTREESQVDQVAICERLIDQTTNVQGPRTGNIRYATLF
jgi:hypothetical protein